MPRRRLGTVVGVLRPGHKRGRDYFGKIGKCKSPCPLFCSRVTRIDIPTMHLGNIMLRSQLHSASTAALLALLMATNTGKAGIVYQNNFEGTVGSEWSSTSIGVTPVGARRFLGQFGNVPVLLSLAGLSAHTEATISFDLYIINTWDGNSSSSGPDRWRLKMDAATLLDATFSQHISSYYQSYPDWTGSGSHPRHTGAEEVGTLGYSGNGYILDSVYHLEFVALHTDANVIYSFSGLNLQALTDESWGLDNIIVSTNATSVPEPSCLAAIWGLLGTLGLTVANNRRRRIEAGSRSGGTLRR